MWRLLHVIAIAALVASAVYVYSLKYQTIYASEQIVKTRHLIAKEHDAINILRADYAFLTRPDRLQALAVWVARRPAPEVDSRYRGEPARDTACARCAGSEGRI